MEDTTAAAPKAKPPITQLTKSDLERVIGNWGERPFRVKQILKWIYEKRVDSFEEMSDLGVSLREALSSNYTLGGLELVRRQGAADTTQKLLFRLTDRRLIECVLIPASIAYDGERSDRQTLCVSSQVGCAYDCKFCASGLAGFTRNLTCSEIVQQVMQTEALSGKRVNNLVFMGMGEPLANLTNLLRAIEIINEPWGIGIGARHITISTSGLAPQIKKLADQPLQLRLAVSLHGATDDVRDRIMPVNKKYPLEKLFEALEYYHGKKKQRMTFEYILIEGVNDALEQATVLAERANQVNAKVNLIPYNTVEGLPWKRPSEDQQEAFLAVLKKAGTVATLRREKGHDIEAACGQLRLQEEAKDGSLAPVS